MTPQVWEPAPCCKACGHSLDHRVALRHNGSVDLLDFGRVTVIRHREKTLEFWGFGELLGWIASGSDRNRSLGHVVQQHPAFIRVSNAAAVRRSAVQRLLVGRTPGGNVELTAVVTNDQVRVARRYQRAVQDAFNVPPG